MEKGREVISPGHPEDFVLPDLGTAFAEMDEDPRLTEKDKLRRKNELTKQLDETGARLHTTSQLLKAYCIYEKDVEYVVKEGKVIIIDQNTGREMPGRRWSDGLHQAVEAKEGVEVERETRRTRPSPSRTTSACTKTGGHDRHGGNGSRGIP